MTPSAHPIFRLLLSPTHLWRTISLGLKSLWLHKLRSFLTALGVVFGVASVVAMLAIGEGASYEAQEQIRKLGSQNIIIESVKPPENQGAGASEARSMVIEYGLTGRDIQQIRQTVPGIEVVVPSRFIVETIWNLEKKIEGQVIGALPIYPQMRNRQMVAGRFFTELELSQRLPVCVLTVGTAGRLFPLSTPIGKAVRIRGFYYKVVGIVGDESGNTDAAASGDARGQMMIPFTTLMDHYGETFFRYKTGGFEAEKVEYHEAVLRVIDPNEVESRADAVREILARSHKKDDWQITVPVELLKQAERTKRIFSIVLGSIAAISLLVGGIGIMNIMLASVTERTREIGIRRALGARQNDIVVQFLIETVLLSGLGGLMGVALGVSIPVLISHFAGVTTVVLFWAPTMAFSISVLTGIAFGIYPARRAAMMNPVEALRHE